MSEIFSGQVALVTGASRGIGAAIARHLARQGAAVVASARGLDDCEALCASIRAEGGRAWAVELDVGDPASIREGVAAARRAHNLCTERSADHHEE